MSDCEGACGYRCDRTSVTEEKDVHESKIEKFDLKLSKKTVSS